MNKLRIDDSVKEAQASIEYAVTKNDHHILDTTSNTELANELAISLSPILKVLAKAMSLEDRIESLSQTHTNLLNELLDISDRLRKIEIKLGL